MKTRIKKVTYGDGSVDYIPQYKCFGESLDLYAAPIIGWYIMLSELFFWQNFETYDCNVLKYTDIEDAKKRIDKYIDSHNTRKEIRLSEKKVKKEYIKYP